MAATFVVEDGTGKIDANVFCTVEFVDAYCENRGITAWAALATSVKQQHIRNGADFLEFMYSERFLGIKKTAEQALSFPRSDLVDRNGFEIDDDSVPARFQMANAEAAVQSYLGEDLMPTLATPGSLKSERIKVGPIEEELEYLGGKGVQSKYTRLDAILAPFVTSGGELVRA